MNNTQKKCIYVQNMYNISWLANLKPFSARHRAGQGTNDNLFSTHLQILKQIAITDEMVL